MIESEGVKLLIHQVVKSALDPLRREWKANGEEKKRRERKREEALLTGMLALAWR